MTKRIVTIEFLFEGKVFERENREGVLFEDNRVLIVDEHVGFYDALPTDNPDKFLIDLDNNGNDYLAKNPEMFIELIVA